MSGKPSPPAMVAGDELQRRCCRLARHVRVDLTGLARADAAELGPAAELTLLERLRHSLGLLLRHDILGPEESLLGAPVRGLFGRSRCVDEEVLGEVAEDV